MTASYFMLDYNTLYEQLREGGMDLDRVVDGLGMPMDEEIKPLVAALNIKGYKTSASCGGHLISEFVRRLSNNSEYKSRILHADRNFIIWEREKDGSIKQHSHFNGPWVDVDIEDKQRQRLVDTVIRHNESGLVTWFLRKYVNSDTKRLQVQPAYHTLESMQEDSLKLAERICNET